MNRQQQLKYCQICINRKMNVQKGLVCSLTDEHATFEDECKDFKIDEKEAAIETERVAKAEAEQRQPEEVLINLDPSALIRLRESQDYLYAILGGLAAALICAFLWAAITIATNYQIGFMAIGVGLAVGFAVRYFGAGVDKAFGVIGAISALLGCFLGNLFTQVWFIAEYQSLSFFNAFKLLDINSMMLIVTEAFSGMDLIFYGIAAYEGYRFAFRNVSVDEITKMNNYPDYNPVPANQQYRMPAVIVTFIFLSVAYFSLSGKVSGFQQYFYENGEIMSEGDMVEGKLNGTWKYYDQSGNVSLIGNYHEDLEDGEWIWYANKNLTKKGNYKKGVPDGPWVNYYEDGSLMDSGNYVNGRMEGYWIGKYTNGYISNEGHYIRDYQNGEWKNYYEDGKIASILNYKNGSLSGDCKYWHNNGQLAKESAYDDQQNERILSAWDINGKPMVVNGNGIYKAYYNNGNILEEGEITNGNKTGNWSFYHSNGNIHSTGKYDNDQIFVLSSYYDEDGSEIINNGTGEVEEYIISPEVFQSGEFVNGYKEGPWNTYNYLSGSLITEMNYKSGKMDGIYKTYHNSGGIYVEGYYENNERTGIWSWYFENGQLETSVTFINGKKEGKQEFYNELGSLVRVEEYTNGEILL